MYHHQEYPRLINLHPNHGRTPGPLLPGDRVVNLVFIQGDSVDFRVLDQTWLSRLYY